MKRIMFVTGFVAAATAAFVLGAAGQDEPNQVAVFMRMKLDHAQRALEGLAVEDFDMLEDAAEGMSLMSLASHWNVLQTQEYLDQSSEFRRAAESLKRAAEDNNLEGATLAYIEVTMSCVKCHKYMREMQLARADFGSP